MKANLRNIENFIFFTTFNGDWNVLEFLGNPFTDMETAIKFIRNNSAILPTSIGLSTFSQMKLGNAQWDNL